MRCAACGVHVDRCVAAAEQLQAQGVSCEIIDLRTIVPLDVDLTITEATVVKWLKAVGDPVKNEGTVVALGEQLGTIRSS